MTDTYSLHYQFNIGNLGVVIILIITAAVLDFIWCLNLKRLKYRKLWIQAAGKLNELPGGVMLQLSIAKQSARHWNQRMHQLEDENAALKKTLAKSNRELTQCMETINGLLRRIDAQAPVPQSEVELSPKINAEEIW